MSPANPVIAVIGAGAVGGYYGARLIQHGFDVHLHMRNDFIRRAGSGIAHPKPRMGILFCRRSR